MLVLNLFPIFRIKSYWIESSGTNRRLYEENRIACDRHALRLVRDRDGAIGHVRHAQEAVQGLARERARLHVVEAHAAGKV